ncbi:CocE/NonD family hydrolase [Rhodococcus triatomae]|uniref:CocE/NonD family hydrolase n=1 Tax=Rhodococcus triatomae TaxID=300028 RepID=UPI00147583DB|nr:CocE/NonD family hydrolase [Rhodococcus triatomae]QNG19827.1 CocE/NonD family hydrolase [Rhodococcus triatomae]QNG24257.1 CocE/NonD family hydrolase [Rhodococcus triatomae]
MSTRDGVLLAGHLYEASGTPRGTVVMRTPYDAAAHRDTARWWARRGFRVLVQDVRGRYRSDGRWVPYAGEGVDGVDTAASLPGPIVAVGASYGAHCAVELARSAAGAGEVAAVVAMVPALGLYESAHHSGGAAQVRDRFCWWHEHGFGRFRREPLSANRVDRLCRLAESLGPEGAARAAGWSARRRASWERLWQAAPLDVADRYRACTAPLLVVGGAYDFFAADAHRLARSWPAPAHLVDGPWGHRMMAGVGDTRLRAALRAHGGPGGAVDAWLSAVLDERPDAWPLSGSSVLDPETGWHFSPWGRNPHAEHATPEHATPEHATPEHRALVPDQSGAPA